MLRRMLHVTVTVGVSGLALMSITVIIIARGVLKVRIPMRWHWPQWRRRHGVVVPLIVIVIVAIVKVIGTVMVVPTIDIVIWATITVLLGICGNKRGGVPRLHVRCLRRRVVRIRGIRV